MEYINDFLYFVIRPHEKEKTIIYCSGVNVTKFAPLTKGKHGQGSNPAIRGLQLIRSGIMDMALKIGGRPRKYNGQECHGITPTMDTWYTEKLIIENVTESFHEEVLRYSVVNLIKKMANALRLHDKMPDELLSPEELKSFIEKLCVKYENKSL